MNSYLHMLAIFIAGGLGTILRALAYQTVGEGQRPWITLLVNLIGSLAIGFVSQRWSNEFVRGVVAVGFLGGFTTFSSMMTEVFRSDPSRAMVIVSLHVLLGYAFVGLGITLARWSV